MKKAVFKLYCTCEQQKDMLSFLLEGYILPVDFKIEKSFFNVTSHSETVVEFHKKFYDYNRDNEKYFIFVEIFTNEEKKARAFGNDLENYFMNNGLKVPIAHYYHEFNK